MANKNIQAFLWAIRCCEGTANPNGYRMLFGGGLFDGFEDHPRILVEKSGYESTAAGAYQILSKTWDSVVKPNLILPDFSPESQDAAAIFLISKRGALQDVKQGRIEQAVEKCNKEWASLPGSPYGQPVYEMEYFKRFYDEAKDKLADRKTISSAKPDPLPDSDDKPDFTEGVIYEKDIKEATGAKYDNREELRKALTEDSFWDKAKRTLKGKNKTGKSIYGVGAALVGVLTGINIEPLVNLLLTNQTSTTMDFLTDINLWTIVFATLSAALGYLKTKSDKEKTAAEKARDEAISQAQLGMELLSEAKRADSEGGTKISTAEKDRIINQAEIVFKSIVNYGGQLIIGEIAPGKYGVKANNVRISSDAGFNAGSKESSQ